MNLDFALRNMDREGKGFALEKIKSIQSGSMTNLSGGLMKGLCQMIDRKEKNEVASVLLFTDGLANHGMCNFLPFLIFVYVWRFEIINVIFLFISSKLFHINWKNQLF